MIGIITGVVLMGVIPMGAKPICHFYRILCGSTSISNCGVQGGRSQREHHRMTNLDHGIAVTWLLRNVDRGWSYGGGFTEVLQLASDGWINGFHPLVSVT